MQAVLSDTLRVLLPSEQDTLLLRACLGACDSREGAWAAWLERVGDPRWELVRRRPTLSPLLPLLHIAARHANVEVPSELAVYLRAAYFREELRSRGYRTILRDVLSALRDVGIDATVLKGAALASTVYDDWALRHCHDIDLLVDKIDLDAASEVLRDRSWGRPLESMRHRSRDVRLVHESGLPIEIHEHLFKLRLHQKAEYPMLKRRRMADVAGVPVHVLSSEDALLHVCALASYCRSRAGLRWAADACSITAKCTELDWDRFLDAAMAARLSLPLFVMLDYLRRSLDAAIPHRVVESLVRAAQRTGRIAREAALFGASASFGQLRGATSDWRSHVFLLRWRLVPTPSYLRWTFDVDPLDRVFRLYIWRSVRRVVRGACHPTVKPVTDRQRNLSDRADPTHDLKTAEHQRPWMPTEQQALLLQAALLEGQSAIDAWSRWKRCGGLARIGAGSVVLLPIVYRNLAEHGVRDAAIEYSRRLYQATRLKNEQLLRALSVLFKSLHAAGVETMILKGVALALLHYRDLGLRSMGDVDVLIHSNDVADAVALLTRVGWKPVGRPIPNLTEPYLSTRRAINLSSDRIKKLDLHWHVIDESCRPNGDDGFWSGAIPTAVCDVETRAMNPTDQLFHVCAHEIRWSPVPLPRWIVDVAMILRSSPERIDGDRLASNARELDLVLPVREALQQALRFVESPIVSSLLEAMHGVPSSRGAIREFRRRSSPPTPLSSIATEFWRMSLQPGRRSVVRRVLALPAHARVVWGLTHAWQLPIASVRWGTRVLVRIVRHLEERRAGQGSTGKSGG